MLNLEGENSKKEWTVCSVQVLNCRLCGNDVKSQEMNAERRTSNIERRTKLCEEEQDVRSSKLSGIISITTTNMVIQEDASGSLLTTCVMPNQSEGNINE